MAGLTQIRELMESVTEVTAHHIRLARLELREDARFVGVRVGLIAALAPLVVVGYGLLCVGAALALRRVMTADFAFLAVGLINLLLGLVGVGRVAKQLQGHQVLSVTASELKATSATVRSPGARP